MADAVEPRVLVAALELLDDRAPVVDEDPIPGDLSAIAAHATEFAVLPVPTRAPILATTA